METDKDMETRYGSRHSSYNLRPRRKQNYQTEIFLAQIEDNVINPRFDVTAHVRFEICAREFIVCTVETVWNPERIESVQEGRK